MPRSSAYHLLAVMAERGFVVHFPEEERVGLGVAAFEVGTAYLRHDPLERIAQPLLRRSSTRPRHPPRWSRTWASSTGTRPSTCSRSSRRTSITVVTDIGVRLPAALTASGRAMLGALPRAQVRAAFASPGAFVDRTGHGPTSLSTLNSLLAAERRRGYAEEEGFITPGYASVAVPVLDREQRPVSAIGLTFRVDDVPPARRPRLARAARRCADDLAARLAPTARSPRTARRAGTPRLQ